MGRRPVGGLALRRRMGMSFKHPETTALDMVRAGMGYESFAWEDLTVGNFRHVVFALQVVDKVIELLGKHEDGYWTKVKLEIEKRAGIKTN